MLRRSAIAVLAGCLLSLGPASSVHSQSPTPRPIASSPPSSTADVSGQQVEVTEGGFILTLPGGWTVEDPSEHPFALMARNPERLEECWVVVAPTSLYGGSGLEEIANEWAIETKRAQRLDAVPEQVLLVMPSGEAVRLDDGSAWHDSFTYVWLHEDELHALTCQGLDPGDQWLPIAESYERLPTAVAPAATPRPSLVALAPTPRPSPAPTSSPAASPKAAPSTVPEATPSASPSALAADTVVKTIPDATAVRVVDRGSIPRRFLRYQWDEGQKETVTIDLRMAIDMALGLESPGEVEVPTIRMTATIEVVEALQGGEYVIEQVITDVGVPLRETGDLLAARVLDAEVSQMTGLTVRSRIDSRGTPLESELRLPPGLEPEAVDSLGSSTEAMAQLVAVLPEEKVGAGAIWRTTQQLPSDMGFRATQHTRTRLEESDGDQVRLRTSVNQTARSQPMEDPDSASGLEMTLDSHEATAKGSAAFDLRRLVPESTSSMHSHTEFTARQGKQVQTFFVDVRLEIEARPMPDKDTNASTADVAPKGGRILRPDAGFAVTFAEGWRVENTSPETHDWLYAEDGTELERGEKVLLRAYPGDAVGHCTVVDLTGLAQQSPVWTTVDDILEWNREWMEEGSGWREAEGSVMGLLAGRTLRISALDDEGWRLGSYSFQEGDSWFRLACWSPRPPTDNWLSVAETFEILGNSE